MTGFLTGFGRMAVVGGLLAALVLLVGCASPRFETSVSYLPPADEQGLACIENCAHELEACQKDCAASYEACREAAQPAVQERFDEAVHQYERLRHQYEMDRTFFEINRSLRWSIGFGHGYYDPRFDGPWGWGGYWDRAPVPPPAPSMEEIRERVVAERCNAQCDCQPRYEQCYIGCGGQINREERCVANCGSLGR